MRLIGEIVLEEDAAHKHTLVYTKTPFKVQNFISFPFQRRKKNRISRQRQFVFCSFENFLLARAFSTETVARKLEYRDI